MNGKLDPFEERLRRQPLKAVPAEWRAEILAAAADRPSPVARPTLLSTLNAQLSTLLWPHPAAWAGLAAVWIFICAMNFSIHDRSPVVAEEAAPPSREMMAEIKEQRRLLAELIGPRETFEADRVKSLRPGPRTERVDFWTV